MKSPSTSIGPSDSFEEGEDVPTKKSNKAGWGRSMSIELPGREKAYVGMKKTGQSTFQAMVQVADKSTPLNLSQASLKIKIIAMVVLLAAFLTGLIWSIMQNLNCTERNGCLTCSILNEKSKDLYDKADNVKKRVALGVQNQELISSCTRLDIAAKKSVIKKMIISDELWDTIVEDMVQMNLYFTANDCSYKAACNMHEWKSCDGGTAGDAFEYDAYGCRRREDGQCVWDKGHGDEINATQILKTLLGSVQKRAEIMKYFKYDEDDILVDIKSDAWKKNNQKNLRRYMTRELGYTDVKKDLEWIHIKETMLSVCHIRSLWTFSSRIYVASKLGAYVSNGCKRIEDNRKLSETAVQNVLDALVPAVDPDLWENYFEPMAENVGLSTPSLVESCSQDSSLRQFDLDKFVNNIDSSTKTDANSVAATCDHLTPVPTTSSLPTLSPSQKPAPRPASSRRLDEFDDGFDDVFDDGFNDGLNDGFDDNFDDALLDDGGFADDAPSDDGFAGDDALLDDGPLDDGLNDFQVDDSVDDFADDTPSDDGFAGDDALLDDGLADDGLDDVVDDGVDDFADDAPSDDGFAGDDAVLDEGLADDGLDDGLDDTQLDDGLVDDALDDFQLDDGFAGDDALLDDGSLDDDVDDGFDDTQLDDDFVDGGLDDFQLDDGGDNLDDLFGIVDDDLDDDFSGDDAILDDDVADDFVDDDVVLDDDDITGDDDDDSLQDDGFDDDDSTDDGDDDDFFDDDDDDFFDDFYYYFDFYYYDTVDDEKSAGGNLPAVNPERLAANNALMRSIQVPGDFCSAGFPSLQVRPFAVALNYDPTAGGDCYSYLSEHLIYSPEFLTESPCGAASTDESFQFKTYGKYGSFGDTLFTYISIQKTKLGPVTYDKERCMSYVQDNKLEIRAVKHKHSSCTPTSPNYYENEVEQPNYAVAGTNSSYVRSESVISDSEAQAGVNPPNLAFTSEMEVCGPYQHLGSNADHKSGLYKVCIHKTENDTIATVWAFAGLWLTGAGISLAILLRLLFPKSINTDQGMGGMLAGVAGTMGGVSGHFGVEGPKVPSAPPAVNGSVPSAATKIKFEEGTSDFAMETVQENVKDAVVSTLDTKYAARDIEV